MKFPTNNSTSVAEEMFWLAWNACGGPLGMGVFQNKPGATKAEVLDNIYRRGDYLNAEGTAYADYVFGRMMKLGIKVTPDFIEVNDSKPTWDYQAWCTMYPDYESLFNAAVQSLENSQ
jgi:hypothetical protein